MTYALGIDVGTTYSAAAIWSAGRAESVMLGDRAGTVPSVLFLRDDGAMLVGDAAERRAATQPGRVAREFKRRVGDRVPVVLGGEQFSAEHLAAQMTRWVADKVAERQGSRPAYAVLTHPASWGEHRRSLLAEAASAAGLADAGLLAEPVAAGLYYASQERVELGTLLGVYDLGGGTFDAAILRKTAGGFELVGVPGGDDRCGGIDLDQAVLDHVVASVGPAWPTDHDETILPSLARVRAAAVEAKEALSSDTQAVVPVVLPGYAAEIRINRSELEEAARPMLQHTIDRLRHVCRRADLQPGDLHTVLLVGGASRMPLVAQLVTEALGLPVVVDAHPKYAVCLGAAIAAASRLEKAPAPAHPISTPVRPERVHADPVAETLAPAGDIPPTRPAPAIPAAGVTLGAPAVAAVAVSADLDASALSEPSDVRLPPPGWRTERPLTLLDQDLRLEVRVGGHRGGRPKLLASAALAAVGLLAAVALMRPAIIGRDTHGSGDEGSRAHPTDELPGPPAAAGGTVGTLDLTRVPLPDATAGVLAGISALDDGRLVAVGQTGGGPAGAPSSAESRPAVWLSADRGGSWTLTWTGEDPGALTALTAADSRAPVAVGWTTSASGDGEAAVWRATNEGLSGFELIGAGPGIGMAPGASIDDVIATADGLMAVGTDPSTDPDGDGAVWRSPDGASWERLDTRRLDGPGVQELHQIIELTGGGFMAVGRQMTGAAAGPAVWTSRDGAAWDEVGAAPSAADGTPSLWALGETVGGVVVVGGTVTPAGESDAASRLAAWTAPSADPATWREVAVTTSDPAALGQGIRAAVQAPDGHLAFVGTANGGGTSQPLTWLGTLTAT